jgi:hypothetical protein
MGEQMCQVNHVVYTIMSPMPYWKLQFVPQANHEDSLQPFIPSVFTPRAILIKPSLFTSYLLSNLLSFSKASILLWRYGIQ